MSRRRWPLAGVLALALAGCEVGPDFVAPGAPEVRHYSAGGDPVRLGTGHDMQRFDAGAPLVADWWHVFGSKSLDGMIGEGLRNSPGLVAAEATLRQSEAGLKAGEGVFYPQADLGGSFRRERFTPAALGFAGAPGIFSLYTLSASVSYVLDVFGGSRR